MTYNDLDTCLRNQHRNATLFSNAKPAKKFAEATRKERESRWIDWSINVY